MWNQMSERARKVVYYAQEVAEGHGHNFVTPEHLLHGLLREDDAVAGILLRRLGCDADALRSVIERQLQAGPGRTGEDMKLCPRSVQVMGYTSAEGKRLKHDWIGTEHLLLGVVAEGRGAAFKCLRSAGVDLHRVRSAVLEFVEGAQETWPPAPTTGPPVSVAPVLPLPDPQMATTSSQPASSVNGIQRLRNALTHRLARNRRDGA